MNSVAFTFTIFNYFISVCLVYIFHRNTIKSRILKYDDWCASEAVNILRCIAHINLQSETFSSLYINIWLSQTESAMLKATKL